MTKKRCRSNVHRSNVVNGFGQYGSTTSTLTHAIDSKPSLAASIINYDTFYQHCQVQRINSLTYLPYLLIYLLK